MNRFKHLLAASAVLALVSQVVHAGPIVYENNFSIHGNVAPGSALSDNGWGGYVTASDTSVLDVSMLVPVLGGVDWGGTSRGTATHNSYLWMAPKNEASTAAGVESLLFSADLGATVSLAALESIAVKQSFDGSVADSAKGRFSIKIGSAWYASAYNWSSESETGTNYEDELLSGVDFTDGNNWLNMTATVGGVGAGDISLGAAVGGTLTGEISAFGVYAEHGNGGDHIRIDDYVVTIPEPATLGLIALFGGGLVFVRRVFKV
ncbi:PEP-CTERM sorting domain-containing protein [Pontiellaceae bacterium B12227]|nr:PEP-CTERM sorting domain-containing protein [Pontiellaceae bacterium B12227]